jgi:SOS-response transcriptional repressor LexA
MESHQSGIIINHTLNKLIPLAKELSELEVPYCGEVSAGFSSEAFNYMEEGIDFNRLLVTHKETTFCLKTGGNRPLGNMYRIFIFLFSVFTSLLYAQARTTHVGK